MKARLEAINQMQADRGIGRYAIGGAVGATFCLEPAATLDLNIFATLPAASGGCLVSRRSTNTSNRVAARLKMCTL